jgi:hypothetical protein
MEGERGADVRDGHLATHPLCLLFRPCVPITQPIYPSPSLRLNSSAPPVLLCRRCW